MSLRHGIASWSSVKQRSPVIRDSRNYHGHDDDVSNVSDQACYWIRAIGAVQSVPIEPA